jgi:hypothetical protein
MTAMSLLLALGAAKYEKAKTKPKKTNGIKTSEIKLQDLI